MTVFEYLTIISSLLSLVTALVAVVLTRRTIVDNRNYNETTIRDNRYYNKLSLRPFLLLRQHFGGSQGNYGTSVTNEGLGPALIRQCEIHIATKKLDGGWQE
jgi:hypothetical protein